MGIVKSLDKIQFNFLWEGSELRTKIHLVSWKKVCLSKIQGGLGVRNLREVNECLLLKWWWRYGREENALWKQVLCSKYGGFGGRWSPLLVGSVVGNGRRIRFWIDRWFSNQSLCKVFPRLFSLSTEKGESLLHFVQRKGEGRDWKLAFRRPLFAWKEEEVSKLNDLLQNAPTISALVEDSCSWLVWKIVESSNGPAKSITRNIWRNIALPKVQFLSWLAWRVETMKHVLLHCHSIWRVWSDIVNWWNLSWIIPGSVEELLQWWSGSHYGVRLYLVLLEWWLSLWLHSLADC
ncbi:uncharacterized protein LOC114261230 [Camellia sinensis]|uniref:uncharacterized protein LOC114261230 n=1 Tax=Camellia sinensis TaxID=4442 RepID=UPI001036D7D2|nr:uncharacterized protein LOC114261230 [Camellia sinensis]